MKTFGEYIRSIREDEKLPLRKVAAILDIDSSVLSKIERNERKPTTEMIPLLAISPLKSEIEIDFYKNIRNSGAWRFKIFKRRN